MSMICRLAVVLLLVAPWSTLQGASPEEHAAIAGFLKQHCVRCHGPEAQEAKLRLDRYGPNTSNEEWTRVADALEFQAMPPPGEPQPDEIERRRALGWLDARLGQSPEPALALRRMNRAEYEATLHDLLGIDKSLKDLLPEDDRVQGFDNVAGGLSISAILLERYLETADKAFDAVIRRIEPLPPQVRRSVAMEEQHNRDSVEKKKGGTFESHGSFVKIRTGWPPTRFDSANPIEDGVYKVRIAVWPYEPGERTLAMAVFNGSFFSGAETAFEGIYDVTGTHDNPRIIEFTTWMRDGAYITLEPRIFPPHERGDERPQPGVAVKWIETEGPLDQAFPSEAQNKLMGKLPMWEGNPIWMRHRKGVRLHHVTSETPEADLERILNDFIPRAFRRPVDDALVAPFVNLAVKRFEAQGDFEDALRVGVTAVLSSPHFLLLNNDPDVDDYTLASRLSYFLWSSLPDDELLALAASGRLRDPKVLHGQVDRMLADPRIERFIENFTGQWLDLREIEETTPDSKLYPEFDPLLQWSMVGETQSFFRHVLKHNLSVTTFIDSDFALLNERIARHYGIEGVRGHERFQVVKLPQDSPRGGILTQASVLKVTANGTTTSPVLRGVWMLENILGQPVPPPPAGVPAVEPDIRGASSIREQLALHSGHASCARCHLKIDPPGFALECFDPIGGYRTFYRSLGEGERIPGVKTYRQGPAVDMAESLGDGQEFDDFLGFRRLLVAQPDPVIRCLAEKLLVYGTGRPITSREAAYVDEVVRASGADNHGLRSMIHAVVASELFTKP